MASNFESYLLDMIVAKSDFHLLSQKVHYDGSKEPTVVDIHHFEKVDAAVLKSFQK